MRFVQIVRKRVYPFVFKRRSVYTYNIGMVSDTGVL